jgi:pimeloyl-ACP methyl ester carboxylesterase
MYRTWRRQVISRLQQGSSVQTTSRGPVEYCEIGKGAPVVVLHGVMGGYDQGLAIAESIALPDVRFLALSRPGYLRTPLDTGRSYEQQADIVAAFLESIGLTSAVVIGVSGGGPAAIQFAYKYRDKCSGLILLSAVTKRRPTPDASHFPLFRLADLAGWLMQGAIHRHPARYTGRLLLPAEAAMLSDAAKRAAFLRFLDTSVPFSFRQAGLLNDSEQMRSISELVPQGIDRPTLIVHGTADRIVPYAHATAAAAAIPGARLLSIDGGGHLAALFHADEVRRGIREFLPLTESRTVAS